MNPKPGFQRQQENRGGSVRDYWPLLILLIVTAAAALAIADAAGLTGMRWMHAFMGLFLTVFALLKLFHPAAFADGFAMYDLIAKRLRAYAYLYPLIELGLGLAYLAHWRPVPVYITTFIVMSFGSVGVIGALRKGLDINCPCMGSLLDVPLSTVTLSENIGMGVMALVMWFMLSH